MRIFLTGATSFVGSHNIPELLGTGRPVIGLMQSDEGAGRLAEAGVESYSGTLEEPERHDLNIS